MFLLPFSEMFWFCFCRSFSSLLFPTQRSSFSIRCRAGLVVLHSLSFCLSVMLLISPLNLNETLAGQSNLDCRFFPFITLSISCHSLLACRVSAEKSVDNLMRIPLYVIFCFPLAAFNIFSLNLIFVSLINMCLGVFPRVYPVWDSLCFPDLGDNFLSYVREVFHYNLLKYFLRPFLFLFFFWDPII